MARGKANGRSMRARRRGQQRVPRSLSLGCVVRRAYQYGNIPYAGAADGGIQIGITPTAVLDWSSFAAVWQRFRILSATVNFVVFGQQDATPTYTTLYVYHDTVSSGAPATIFDALVRKGRRIMPFSASKMHHSFTFKPLPWTSSGLSLTAASPESVWSPVSGAAPFTSAAAWMQNYNSTTQAPGINGTIELLLEFDSPQ